MTNGGKSGNILAILASVGLHALLLLIPWQPAASIDLLPLEGTGVVELAVLQPVRGETDAQVQQSPEPVVEPEPAQPQAKPEPTVEPVKQVAVAKPKPTVEKPTPNVSIKPVTEAPKAQPQEEVVTAQAGTAVVPATESQGTEGPAEPVASEGEQTEQKAPEPARPAFPGEDPTGEAMVASKRAVAYPKESMNSSSEGTVTVEVTVNAEGTIRSVSTVSGPVDEWMRKNAEQTILRYWSFRSADWAYKVTIEVSFRLKPLAETSLKFIGASFLD